MGAGYKTLLVKLQKLSLGCLVGMLPGKFLFLGHMALVNSINVIYTFSVILIRVVNYPYLVIMG